MEENLRINYKNKKPKVEETNTHQGSEYGGDGIEPEKKRKCKALEAKGEGVYEEQFEGNL